jgi:hypothetical protein
MATVTETATPADDHGHQRFADGRLAPLKVSSLHEARVECSPMGDRSRC